MGWVIAGNGKLMALMEVWTLSLCFKLDVKSVKSACVPLISSQYSQCHINREMCFDKVILRPSVFPSVAVITAQVVDKRSDNAAAPCVLSLLRGTSHKLGGRISDGECRVMRGVRVGGGWRETEENWIRTRRVSLTRSQRVTAGKSFH